MNTLARKAIGNECVIAICDVGIRAAAIRNAEPADREFVISLVPRLVASGLPPWRDPRRMYAAYIEVIDSIIHEHRIDAALLIAEDEHAAAFGFVLLVAAADCYTHARRGHLARFVVLDGQHEFPAGLALIVAAETWARSRGGRVLTPGEFWANHPARVVCDYTDSSLRR